MITLTIGHELNTDLEEISDENIIEAYVTAILNKWYNNLKLLEKELFKRKLFLIALERYDKKQLGIF